MRSAPEWYGNPVLEVIQLDHDEPTNYEEVMVSPDSAKWFEAMKSEMGSMYENKVWTLVDLPDDRQAIENKWIFKKTDADGNVTVYKARLVAKGFRQVQGIDYDALEYYKKTADNIIKYNDDIQVIIKYFSDNSVNLL